MADNWVVETNHLADETILGAEKMQIGILKK